jgi:hypothetical protein
MINSFPVRISLSWFATEEELNFVIEAVGRFIIKKNFWPIKLDKFQIGYGLVSTTE